MSLVERVAARSITAETLTKSWLMGVRRGFLSLLKPTIHSYDDVFRALGKLEKFVENLRQQVTYVRRGPLSGLAESDESKKLAEAFAGIMKVLEDAASKARHWQECYDGTDLNARHGWGSCREDGEKMLEAYRTRFRETLQGYVKTRGKLQPERSADITEFLDKILAILYADAKAIQDNRKVDPNPMAIEEGVFTEFSVGRMKIVVVDPKIRPAMIRRFVADIDKAYKLLQRAKFADKVWYGILFIIADHAYVLPEHERHAYQRYGYNIDYKSGDYNWTKDAVRIWSDPPITGIILHELGHRYWFKGMSQTQRGKFESLVRVKTKLPFDYDRTIKDSKVQEVRAELSQATDQFRAAFKFIMGAPKRGKYRKLLDAFRNGVHDAAREFARRVETSIGSLSATNLSAATKALRTDCHNTLSEISSRAFNADQEINSLMMRTPEPNGPIDNLDRYWFEIYFRKRDEWAAEFTFLIDSAEAQALAFVNTATFEHNQRELDQHADAMREYNALVPAVSQYGETNVDEAFAEVFMDYCLGRDLTRDQIESFRSVIVKSAASLERRVVERFTRTRGHWSASFPSRQRRSHSRRHWLARDGRQGNGYQSPLINSPVEPDTSTIAACRSSTSWIKG